MVGSIWCHCGHKLVIPVLVLVLCVQFSSSWFPTGQQIALNRLKLAKKSLDFIKLNCPLVPEYDELLICCKLESGPFIPVTVLLYSKFINIQTPSRLFCKKSLRKRMYVRIDLRKVEDCRVICPSLLLFSVYNMRISTDYSHHRHYQVHEGCLSSEL